MLHKYRLEKKKKNSSGIDESTLPPPIGPDPVCPPRVLLSKYYTFFGLIACTLSFPPPPPEDFYNLACKSPFDDFELYSLQKNYDM